MLQEIFNHLSQLNVTYIYLTLFFFAFIENVFPPSPSDVVVIIGASLIAKTSMGFVPVLLITSVGSAMGFILMYYVGFLFSEKIIRSKKLKFISPEALIKADEWFSRYGYFLILANRFLPGTRSVISFFAGVHELKVTKTFVFALISAFLWNTVIILLGMELGENINKIQYYLNAYSNIILALTAAAILFALIRYFIKKRKKRNA